jgi:hypothetical protein
MKSAGASLTLIVTLVTGCYTYRALPSLEPVTGTRVSAELTDEGARELSGNIGPAVEHIEGQVLRVDSATIELAVLQVEGIRGWQSDWNGERVAIPRKAVAGLQQRRFSLGGTGFVGGLVAGGVYALYRLLGGPGIFEGGGRGSGGQSH